jgi:hypothetical protein
MASTKSAIAVAHTQDADSCSVSSEEAWDATYNVLGGGGSQEFDYAHPPPPHQQQQQQDEEEGEDDGEDADTAPLPAEVIEFGTTTTAAIRPDVANSSLRNDFYYHDERSKASSYHHSNNTNNNTNTANPNTANHHHHHHHDQHHHQYQQQQQRVSHPCNNNDEDDEDFVEYIDPHPHQYFESSPIAPSYEHHQLQKHNYRREQSVNSINFYFSEQPNAKKQKFLDDHAVASQRALAPAATQQRQEEPRKPQAKTKVMLAVANKKAAAALPAAATTTNPMTAADEDDDDEMAGCSDPNHNSSKGDISFHSFQSNQWQARFDELVAYKTVNGHCCIPTKCQINYPLAQWVKRQRYQYRLKQAGKKSTMTTDRQKSLEDLGFIWDLHDSVWEERLNELYAFRTQHGHCKVPLKYPANSELAIWAKCQRRHYMTYCTVTNSGKEWTSNTMTMERIHKLTKVGFVFSNRNNNNNNTNNNSITASGDSEDFGDIHEASETTAAPVDPSPTPTTVSIYNESDSEELLPLQDARDDAWEPIQITL